MNNSAKHRETAVDVVTLGAYCQQQPHSTLLTRIHAVPRSGHDDVITTLLPAVAPQSYLDTLVSSPFPRDIILFYCLGTPSCVLENNHCSPTYQTRVIYQFFPRECFIIILLVLWPPFWCAGKLPLHCNHPATRLLSHCCQV